VKKAAFVSTKTSQTLENKGKTKIITADVSATAVKYKAE
jgi:hypothetical protein